MTAPDGWTPEVIYLTEVDYEDPDYPLVWASISEDSGGEKYVRTDLVDARIAELDAANKRLFEALDAIRQYCNDTFSGPTTGPLDAEWYRAAVIASRDRARNAMEGRKWNENEDGSDGSNPGAINWRDDPAAIVEDDEPQIWRDYA